MGSGIKCGCAVWTALGTNRAVHRAWAHALPDGEAAAVAAAAAARARSARARRAFAALALAAVLLVLALALLAPATARQLWGALPAAARERAEAAAAAVAAADWRRAVPPQLKQGVQRAAGAAGDRLAALGAALQRQRAVNGA